MTRIIAAANQKGGVGKTTTIATLGAALAEMGQRVLLIDLDSQGALSATFGFDVYDMDRSTYSLLMYKGTPVSRVTKLINDNLALLPASIDLSAAEMQLITQPDHVTRLRDALSRAPLPFDLILIDTPSNLGLLTANALTAAGEVIIPVQCHYLAMRGVRSLINTIRRVRERMNPALQPPRFVLTMWREDRQHTHEVAEEVRKVFGDRVYDTTIPDDGWLPESPFAGETVITYEPDGPAAHAYRALAQEVLHDGRS